MRPPGKSREGAALVVTLLLLALMVTVTLLYATLVRLERAAISWGVGRSRAVQGLQTALAWAISDLQEDLYGDEVFTDPARFEDWVSKGGGDTPGPIPSLLAQDLGLPQRFWLDGPGSLADLAGRATWEVHGNPEDWHLATAWAGVDLTGLLDPEMPELPLERLGLLHLQNDPPALTPREFLARHPEAVQVFVPQNRGLDRGWYDAGRWRESVTLGTQEVGMDLLSWNRDQILAVMSARYPAQDAEDLADAFEDFRSRRRVPSRVQGLTAVPVPMFNEAVVGVEVTYTEETAAVTLTMDFEVWFPFRGDFPEQEFRIPESPAVTVHTTHFVPETSGPQWTFARPAPFARPSLSIRVNLNGPLPGDSFALEVDLSTLRLVEMETGAEVDRMPENFRVRFDALTVPEEGGSLQTRQVWEVLDPRLNHRPDQWQPQDADSLGQVNAITRQFWEDNPLRDQAPLWLPAASQHEENPLATEPSQVRFFPVGEPWQSVQLLGPDGRWWLRHTRPSAWQAGWRRHRVNPNSAYPEALEAVFAMARIRRWPEDPQPLRLADPQLWALAELLQARVADGRGFTQRGDWTAALALPEFWTEENLWGTAASPSDPDRVTRPLTATQIESLISQMDTRFETASQLWGLLLFSEWRGPGGTVQGRSRAWAMVRRDPFADEHGKHAYGIQLWFLEP